ncbi:hypothetical protein MKW92_001231 [Papaver armeniacum]|nr:hypothetical protein MKW92_001231 [Papaver armeniacum]
MEKENQIIIIELEEEDVAELAPFDPSKKKEPVREGVVLQNPLEGTDRDYEHEEVHPLVTKRTFSDISVQVKEDEEGEGIVLQNPLEGTDRDYEHEEVLGRVFHILRENNPELAGDMYKPAPKKTVLVNFMDFCKTMCRQLEHVMTFLLAEMGTSGSLDGQQRLVVKGSFSLMNFEGILQRYHNEYVICNGCKIPNTIISKENRLFFLVCEKCGSERSVAPIKAGFVACVGHRKAGT